MSTVFIVSTGRCGSTFISRMLNAHPDVLSLNEFYAMLIGRAFPPGPLDGAEFWGLLTEPNQELETMLRKGAHIPELLYPYQTGKFNLQTGVPPLLYCTLPLLTDDPDGLYQELAPVVPRWPRQPLGAHYQRLFGWLADRFERSIVVERSGQSVNWIPQLRALFPDARFVHLYRNGPDCALDESPSRFPVPDPPAGGREDPRRFAVGGQDQRRTGSTAAGLAGAGGRRRL